MSPPALTRDQAERLREDVGRHLRYLRRCRLRMEQLGYISSDPLYGAICEACNSVQGVFVLAHYASCKPKDAPAEPESAANEVPLPP